MNTYHSPQILYQSERVTVSRAIRDSDGRSVILKSQNAEFPSLRDLTRIKMEFELSQKFSPKGMVPILGIEKQGNGFTLVMEDVGGIPLLDYWNSTSKTLSLFLELAISISGCISDLHLKGIIHKDIKPANILVNPNTNVVYIIDLGLASLLQTEEQSPVQPDILEGTLAYISPEQTGRMNRSIDFRTDLYSIGVTFYELLTEVLPFQSNDPIELVHAHIALSPKAPIEIQSLLPQSLSDMILKLLSKNAEDRYHSVQGLREDLILSRELLSRDEKISFVPGERESKRIFSIPQKLYGREAEVTYLLDAFDQITTANKSEASSSTTIESFGVKLVLVGGYSGVGKTALINEVHKPILEKRGYFLSGKFDQFKRNIPYYTLLQAFSGLIRQILAEREENINIWKEKILQKTHPNTSLLVDLIPELIHLTGNQFIKIEPSKVDGESFRSTFIQFIGVFAGEKHPLTLFVDDLQWADIPTLQFIEFLTKSKELKHILLLGAYRDNEVDELHPVHLMINSLEKEEISILKIFLAPLHEFFIERMICDTFHKDVGLEFPGLVYKKTGGNPFFVKQFLETLYEDQCITYSETEGWCYDIQKINTANYTENVVSLVANRLQTYTKDTLDLLKLASCVGASFSLSTLSRLLSKSTSEIVNLLEESLVEGVILPESNLYRNAILSSENESLYESHSITYRFLHDRVQQAAYSLFTEEEAKQAHILIGKTLLHQTSAHFLEEQIFEITNHLNYGIDTDLNEKEKEELLRLNSLSAKKASDSFAYSVAMGYYEKCINLIGIDTDKEIVFTLNYEYLQSMYKSGMVHEVRDKIDELHKFSDSKFQKAMVYNLKVICQTNIGEIEGCIFTCIEALKLFGFNLKSNINNRDLFVAYKKLYNKLKDKNLYDIYNLPEMINEEVNVIMEILMNASSSAFWKHPTLSSILNFTMIDLSLEYGNNFVSAFGYGCYGISLLSMGDNFNSFNYGQLALKLSQKYQNYSTVIKVPLLLGFSINNYSQHCKYSIQLMMSSFNTYIGIKDIVYGACIIGNSYQLDFIFGTNLIESTKYYYSYKSFLQKNKSYDFYFLFVYLSQFINILSDKKIEWIGINDETIQESDVTTYILNSELKLGIYYYYVNLMYLQFLLQKDSLEYYLKTKNYREYGITTMSYAQDIFISSLLLLKYKGQELEDENSEISKEFNTYLKQYKKWAETNPANFLHKYKLILAEYAKFKKEYWEASGYYEEAIRAASENEYNLDAGLCCELAGNFYEFTDRIHTANKYFSESVYYYDLCGAKAKSKDILKRYPHLAMSQNARTSSIQSTMTQTINYAGSKLDVLSITRATTVLSAEIKYESLLEKLIFLLLENAGAERGAILLFEESALYLEGTGESSSKSVKIFHNENAENYTKIPFTIVKYVERTNEALILDSAIDSSEFSKDPYIQTGKIISLLCMPIVSKGKTLGFLYLENNKIRSAFSIKRIEILNIIVSQAAISIENAKLYNHLEEKVAKRTIELNERNKKIENQKKFVEELNDLLKIISNSFVMETILDTLNKFINQTFQMEHLALTIVDDSNQFAILKYCTEPDSGETSKKIRDTKIPLLNVTGAHAYSYLTGKTLFTKTNKKFRTTPEEKQFTDLYNFQSYLIIPLIIDEKKIGFLNLGSTSIHYLSKEQITQLSILAEQVAGIIYRSNLNTMLQFQKDQIEKSLIQSERMITLGTMVAGVAHEINTPLGAIKASSENISASMNSLLQSLNPDLSSITIDILKKVISILELSVESKVSFSSKEQRALRKKMIIFFETKEFKNAEDLADKILELGLSDALERGEEILSHAEIEIYLNMASHLKGIQKKSNVIQTSAERVSKIVKSLKSFMHFEQSEEKKIADLTEGMETVLVILNNKIKYGIEVIKNYGSIPLILCYADELNQIWTNLIHNAVQAMQEKGTLQIDIEKIASLKRIPDIDKRNPNYKGEFISVSIQDSGHGIPPEIRQKIFQAFFTTKVAGEGSGLGLHIIGKILEKHGGALVLESVPGRTRFTVVLPIGEGE